MSEEPTTMENFFRDLGSALKTNEVAFKSNLGKLKDLKKGKPSKQAIARTIESLATVVETSNTLQSCVITHLQNLLKAQDIRIRAIVKNFEERGLVTKDDLEKTMTQLIEEEKKEQEKAEESALSESLDQAKEEAGKRTTV